jgi:hypothetical protein
MHKAGKSLREIAEETSLAPGTVAVPLRSQPNASPFWIMLLLVSGRLDNGMIRIWQSDTGVVQMPSTDPTPSVTADQLTRALGEAVIRIWSNLPQDVQLHLFQEAVTSHGESIRAQLAVFLHDKHPRTSDPLGNPREMMEPDSLGG